MITKFYYDRESAPLKLHRLIWYIGLPVALIFDIAALYAFRNELEYGSSLIMLSSLLSASGIAFKIAAFAGFFHWKSYAWYSLIISAFLSSAKVLTVLILNSSLINGLAFFISLILCPLIYIYYKKRKALFFADKMELYYASAPRCPHCGHPIEPGEKLCPMCGMSYSMYSGMDFDEYQNQ